MNKQSQKILLFSLEIWICKTVVLDNIHYLLLKATSPHSGNQFKPRKCVFRAFLAERSAKIYVLSWTLIKDAKDGSRVICKVSCPPYKVALILSESDDQRIFMTRWGTQFSIQVYQNMRHWMQSAGHKRSIRFFPSSRKEPVTFAIYQRSFCSSGPQAIPGVPGSKHKINTMTNLHFNILSIEFTQINKPQDINFRRSYIRLTPYTRIINTVELIHKVIKFSKWKRSKPDPRLTL